MTTPGFAHPSAEGNLAFVLSRNQFPSIGGVPQHRAPRDVSRGWFGRGGQRVQEKTLTPLTCHSRARLPHNKYSVIPAQAGIGSIKIHIAGFIMIKTQRRIIPQLNN